MEKNAPDIQISTEEVDNGSPFKRSLRRYATSSEKLLGVIETTLSVLKQTEFYKKRIQRLEDVRNSDKLVFDKTDDESKNMKMVTSNLTVHIVNKNSVDFYNAYWTMHHYSDEIIQAGNNEKIRSIEELHMHWETVWHDKLLKEQGKKLKDAIILVLKQIEK